MNEKILLDIKDDVGYLKGKVEGIDNKLCNQKEVIKDLKKSVHRHDVVLGKVGLVFTAIIGVASLAGNVVVDLLFNKK